MTPGDRLPDECPIDERTAGYVETMLGAAEHKRRVTDREMLARARRAAPLVDLWVAVFFYALILSGTVILGGRDLRGWFRVRVAASQTLYAAFHDRLGGM